MADWATISSLATAGGTLVLAAATFASVRSANRAARVAERSFLANQRPVLAPSRLEDPPEKVGFQDDHWIRVEGGHGAAEVGDEAVYLVIALRNIGDGLAVLHGWRFHPERPVGNVDRPDADEFRRLTRDLWVPAGGLGFWQGAFRDWDDPAQQEAAAAIKERRSVTVDLLYGDQDGGQRTVTRFGLQPHRETDTWLATVSRHWNLDRADPR